MQNNQDLIKKTAERYDLRYNENGSAPTDRGRDGTIKNLSLDFINELFEFKKNDGNFKWTKMPDKIKNDWNVESNKKLKFELAAI